MSYLYCFFAIFFFSTMEVVTKKVGGHISPFTITAYRFLIGAFVLMPFAIVQARRDKLKIDKKALKKMGFSGMLNVTVSMLFLQLSIHYGKAALSAILISTNSVFVAIFAFFILKERLSKLQIMGILAGLIGIGLIISGEIEAFKGSENLILGTIFAIAGAITFGLYTVISKKYIRTYGNFVFNTVSFTWGAIVLLALAFFMKQDLIVEMTRANITLLAYLGIFVTGLGYFLFFEGLKKIPTAIGSSMFFLKPVIASVLAYVFLKETLATIQIIGIIVVIMGVNLERLWKSIMIKQKKKLIIK